MSYVFRIANVGFLILCGLVSIAHAGEGLSRAVTFVVPGISGTIQKLDILEPYQGIPTALFAGESYNGTQLLAAGSHEVVLYDLDLDSVLFSIPLDTAYSEYDIELADVNRDSITDVVIGMFYDWSDVTHRVMCFDGASSYVDVDTLEFPAMFSGFDPSCEFGAVGAADINADGFNELMVSWDSTVSYYSGWAERGCGVTRVYYHFPDSLLIHLGSHLDGLYELPSVPGLPQFVTHEVSHSYDAMMSPDLWQQARRVVPILPDGSVGSFISVQLRSQPELLGLSSTGYISDFCCAVDLDTAVVLVLTFRFWDSSDKGSPTLAFHDTSGYVLRGYSVHPTIGFQLLWEVDERGNHCSQGLYSPDYPGEFFIMCDSDLVRMNAFNGSEIMRFHNMPTGTVRFWGKPVFGESDMLVVTNADTVAFYSFDALTDVPEPTTDPQMPTSFVLDQPYPNPFNAELTVPIEVRERGHLKVEVFNNLGQRVTTLHDGAVAAGPLVLRWNAGVYSSGVYMIRGSFDGQSSAVKAVLLK